MIKKLLMLIGLVVISLPVLLSAGTTGKIAGTVVDKESGDPLAGVNVIVEGTSMGAATNAKGEYFIVNVPVGVYSLKATMIGYKPVRFENVRVSIDRTTRIDFRLPSTILEVGEVVVVTAQRPLIQVDATSSHAYITSDEMESMPVDQFQEVLAIQAGVVTDAGGNLHIRGGRVGEVTYMIDGMYVQNPLVRQMAGDISNNAIQAIEVVSGTYNAEYGQAMSGVVNIVTKSGSKSYHGQFKVLTDMFYRGDDKWSGKMGKEDNANYRNTLRVNSSFSGPIPFTHKKGTFFISGERFQTDGWLYGYRKYTGVPDSINFSYQTWENEGWQNKRIPMQPEQRWYAQAKFDYKVLPALKLTLSGWFNNRDYKLYSHSYKYLPDNIPNRHRESGQLVLTANHQISPRTFYTVKLSQFYQKYHRSVYDTLYDPRVTAIDRNENYEFIVRGTSVSWHKDFTRTLDVKFDVTSQVFSSHEMKAGFEYKRHHLDYYNINDQTIPNPFIIDYVRNPVEMSAYVQDKMEFGGMIVNVGLRMDLIDPNDVYPKDELHPVDASGKIKDPVEADTKIIVSPRVGMAYPITSRAVLHFAYGQFSQVPDYQYLYDNPQRDLRRYYPNVGNPDVRPEKSSAFEVGISQQVGDFIGIDFSGFYKDITDYVTSRLVPAVPDPYTLITNIDYANVKGITLAVKKRYNNYFSGSLNYTYQVAQGNSSDPFDAVNDVFAQPPRETEKHLLYLDWDQTHTVGLNVNIGVPNSWGVNIIGELGSGTPYTPSGALGRIPIADENSERKPTTHNVDIVAYKTFRFGKVRFSTILDIRNVFNQRNHLYVYSSTGRGDVALAPNTTDDFIKDPSNFSPPRNIRLGFEIRF